MKTLKNIEGLTELDICEQRSINGGESLWYYMGYAFGRTVKLVSDALDGSPNTPCANN